MKIKVLIVSLVLFLGIVIGHVLTLAANKLDLRNSVVQLSHDIEACELEIPRKYQCKLQAIPNIPPEPINITSKDVDGKLTP